MAKERSKKGGGKSVELREQPRPAKEWEKLGTMRLVLRKGVASLRFASFVCVCGCVCVSYCLNRSRIREFVC